MGKILFTCLRLLAVPWIGSVAGLAIAYQLADCWLNLPRPQFLLVCCLVPPVLFSAAPVGEIGSVLAAWCARLTLVEVSMFGLALRRADLASPWRLRRKPGLFSPPATTALARDGRDLRQRHQTFILGNVKLQFFLATLCLAAGQSIFAPLDGMARFRPALPGKIAFLFPNTPLIAALNLLAITYATFGLTALVLTKPGAVPSAGAQLQALVCEPHIERSIALAYLQGWLSFGLRPRDWEPSLVARLQEPGTAASEVPAALFLYYHHEDRGELNAAEGHLYRAVALCDKSRLVPSPLAVEAAYVAGLHHRDAVMARGWLLQVNPEEVEAHTRERAEAAVLLAEKRFSDAIAMAEQALASSWRSADPGGAEAERCWIESILHASHQMVDVPPAAAGPMPK